MAIDWGINWEELPMPNPDYLTRFFMGIDWIEQDKL